jgi:hypothetical protein
MVARLVREVLAGGELCSAVRYDQQRIAGNQHDSCGLASPGNVAGMAGNSAFRDVEPIPRLDGADRQRTRRRPDPADGAQPAGEHGFCERDRGGMMAGGAQDRRRLDHAGCALGENVGIARRFDRLPQPVGPGAAFRIGRYLWCDEVAEEPHRTVVEDRVRHSASPQNSAPLRPSGGRGRGPAR